MKKRGLAVLLILVFLLSACGTAAPSQNSGTSEAPEVKEDSSAGVEEVVVPEATTSTDTAVNDEIVSFITQTSSNPDKVLIRYTVTQNNFIGNSPFFIGSREFFRSLKEQLGDKVEIQLYFSAPFGGTNDAFIGGLQNQTFEIIDWPAASFAEYTNAFNPLDTPYLFDDIDDAVAKLNGEVGQIMIEKCIKDTGLRPLAFGSNGMRELTNNVKEVRVPADAKGLKIRVQANPVHIAFIEAMGASAAAISYAELYTALQQGVVDGQENPLTNYPQMNFADVQQYFTYTDHMMHTSVLTVNNDWYESLSDEVKAAIDIAKDRFVEYGVKAFHEQEEMLTSYIENINVYTPTEEEKQEWIAVGKSVWSIAEESCDPGYWAKIVEACGKTAD